MTPAELITTNLASVLAANGVTIDVDSLLLDALAGKPKASPSSFIGVNCHVSGQTAEPLPLYTFDLAIDLVTALDDDSTGTLFKMNYDAIWAAIDYLCRGDNCTALGSESIFRVDGFQLTAGESPSYNEDTNGGAWSCSFSATITGYAPSTSTASSTT